MFNFIFIKFITCFKSISYDYLIEDNQMYASYSSAYCHVVRIYVNLTLYLPYSYIKGIRSV